MPEWIACPDCDQEFPDHESLVAHREKAHPPAPISIAVGGIDSQSRFGTDPKE